jgi:hypothetical protein
MKSLPKFIKRLFLTFQVQTLELMQARSHWIYLRALLAVLHERRNCSRRQPKCVHCRRCRFILLSPRWRNGATSWASAIMTSLRAELIAESLDQVKKKITNCSCRCRSVCRRDNFDRQLPRHIRLVMSKFCIVWESATLVKIEVKKELKKSAQVNGTWHYQGQVQSRKLREIAGWATYIHSIDSPDHALKLSRICAEIGKDISIFLQLSLDGAPDRGGVIAQ